MNQRYECWVDGESEDIAFGVLAPSHDDASCQFAELVHSELERPDVLRIHAKDAAGTVEAFDVHARATWRFSATKVRA